MIDSPSLIRSVLASQSSAIQALLFPCHFYPETKMPAHLPVNHFLEGSHLLTDVCLSSCSLQFIPSLVHSLVSLFTWKNAQGAFSEYMVVSLPHGRCGLAGEKESLCTEPCGQVQWILLKFCEEGLPGLVKDRGGWS